MLWMHRCKQTDYPMESVTPKGDGTLTRGPGDWVDFLSRLGASESYDHAFVARNFLLDEGVDQMRLDSYVMRDYTDFKAWQGAHEAYLKGQVHLSPPSDDGPPTHIDPGDPDLCPETFRAIPGDSPYHCSALNLSLIRIEEVDFIAAYSDVNDAMRIKELATATLVNGPGSDEARQLGDILESWAEHIELRPVFVAYKADIEDLLGEQSSGDAPEWANALRDRLGLAHLNPAERGNRPINVLVFRYDVREVPRLDRAPGDSRPLAVPTVLDASFSQAFCPPPRRAAAGYTINLAGEALEPTREVLHPTLAYQAKHLWRVGRITSNVDLDLLPTARGLHLAALRDHTSRADYALGTDGDLR